jgi:hypothetical protein
MSRNLWLRRRLAALASALALIALSADAAVLRGVPFHFEANRGQLAPAARFVARGGDGDFFFLPGETVLALAAPERPAVLRMRWIGARADVPIVAEQPLAARVHSFRGADPKQWRTDIPTFARVRYDDLYPGIDVAYYGNAGSVEHDLLIAPGADVAQARLAIEGADVIAIAPNGDLAIAVAGRSVRLHAPVSYQERDGVRRPVESRWVLDEQRHASIAVGDYDRARPLVVDPVLTYATFFGGDAEDGANGIHVDASGITFGGNTASTDLPAPAQAPNPGAADAFVAKLDPTGASLLSITYFGGNGEETERDLVVDAGGNAYLFGETTSTNLPTTQGAFDSTCGSDGLCNGDVPDTFVAKLNGATLVYATYLGGSGSDIAGKVAVDTERNAYVAGYTNSIDLPATDGAFDESCGTDGACDDVKRDCFVAKLDASGANLAYLTYLGGSAFDRCFGVAVDGSDRAIVVGSTFSGDFPATDGAYDTTCGDDGACDSGGGEATADDGFVAMLDAAGANLVYATFLGGSGNGDTAIDEYGWAVRADADGAATIVGQTDSSDFPTPNGARTNYGGGFLDAFVAKLDPTGASLDYATYLGGVGTDQGLGLAIDSLGGIIVTGVTDSTDFPQVDALPGPGNVCTWCASGFTEGFVARLDPSGDAFSFSTFLGGSSSDYAPGVTVRGTSLYVLGDTYSADFPTQNPLQAAHGLGENYDVFVARIVPEPDAALLAIASIAAILCARAHRDRADQSHRR